jgi:hypothetical protein
MKKTLFALVLACFILESCATIFCGKISTCQKTKPTAGEPHRQLRVVPFILDSFTTFFVGLIVDFETGAIYKPCDSQTEPNKVVLQISPNNVLVQQLQLTDNQKQVNIEYLENRVPISNKEIFLAYYDETRLKKIVISSKTDDKGIVSFIIPCAKDSGSVPFYFSYNKTDFAGHRFALRIPSISDYKQGGEKTITLKVDKKYYFEFQDAVQLINFPQDGTRTSNGGDIIGKGSFSLR